MAALRGWAPRGERLKAAAPHGHWKTMTFLAALRHDRVEAPWLLDGPIDGESFRLYVERVLAPTLRPDDIVVMDNLNSHKGAAVRRAIRAAGARLFFLPKSSPDLNPIEMLFAQLKHGLRKAAARTQGRRLRRHRPHPRHRHRKRVHQLLHQRRLCSGMNSARSSACVLRAFLHSMGKCLHRASSHEPPARRTRSPG